MQNYKSYNFTPCLVFTKAFIEILIINLKTSIFFLVIIIIKLYFPSYIYVYDPSCNNSVKVGGYTFPVHCLSRAFICASQLIVTTYNGPSVIVNRSWTSHAFSKLELNWKKTLECQVNSGIKPQRQRGYNFDSNISVILPFRKSKESQ